MKVVFRGTGAADGCDYRYSLTISKEYEVIGICADDYQLLNDKNEPTIYSACCFEISDPIEPAFWVSKVGDDGERYAHPPEWSVPGFFEDWHDGVPEVISHFWADLHRLYPWTIKSQRKQDHSA